MSNQVLNGLQAGQSYPNQVTMFIPDQNVDEGASSVIWNLLDDDGAILSTGPATLDSATATISGMVRISISAEIALPSNLPATIQGVEYVLQYIVDLSDGDDIKQFLHHESCTVVSQNMQQMGPVTALEIWGNATPISIVLPHPNITSVAYSLYQGNTMIYPPVDITGNKTPSEGGFTYSQNFDTAQLAVPDLAPLMVMWRYTIGTNAIPQTEMGKLYAVTPRILMAAQQLQQMIQRAVISLDNTVDIIFKPEDLLGWLHMGRGRFNAESHPTDFTMTNASDQVMYYWVMLSAVNALRSQFLVESLKSFDYGGQQVTLSVDHAPAFNEMASNLEQQIQEPLKMFKQLLSKRGSTRGDGNVNGLGLAHGAIGSVGISLSPVSNTRVLANKGSWFGMGRIL